MVLTLVVEQDMTALDGLESRGSTAQPTARMERLADESPILSKAEAGAYLGLAALGVKNPEAAVDRLVTAGTLECLVVLGRRAFTIDQLDAYVQKLKNKKKTDRRKAATAKG